MRRYGIERARRDFKKLVEAANETGAPITITRYGERIAVLMPGRLTVDLLRGLHKAPELIEMALAMASGNKRPPWPDDVKFLKETVRIAAEVHGRND
uniref:Putative antitoxin family protein n=1 Tax=viral metagenome TaxID=1070528 RepID=A0A6M3M0W7_9ZZZZ